MYYVPLRVWPMYINIYKVALYLEDCFVHDEIVTTKQQFSL